VRGQQTAFAPCRFRRHHDREPERVLPAVNGWVVHGEMFATRNAGGFDWFNELDGRWVVPPAPATYHKQTNFFFTGLQSTSGADLILQPVLTYGPVDNGGGQFWNVEAWLYRGSGSIHTAPAVVHAGDTIRTYMHVTHCALTGECEWQISMFVNQTLANYMYVSPGVKLDWALKGVLEAYNITSCSDYPDTTFLDFSRVTLNMPQSSSTLPFPGMVTWVTTPVVHNVNPACGYGVTEPASDSVRLFF
jgi:hypothetical protein